MDEDRDEELRCLLEEIRDEVRDTDQFTGRSSLAARVMAAMRSVPRHAFVAEDLQWAAYANRPLPIGRGQTISQPYIVALMTDLIDPQAGDVVLEIGTGSGYQAAVLSRLVRQVYSLEIIDELAREASQRLRHLGFGNVEVRAGNGHFGWPEHAPYDAIIVTAASSWIPSALIEQLKPGGTLVIPVRSRHFDQDLRVLTKDSKGNIEDRSVLPVIFVPLTGAPEENAKPG